MSDPAAVLSTLMTALWNRSPENEADAVQSKEFRDLEYGSAVLYFDKPGTRFPRRLEWDYAEYHFLALINFFRTIGAPWHRPHCPTADEAARLLHSSYVAPTVKATYFAPLCGLKLVDGTEGAAGALHLLPFGDFDIWRFTSAELSRRLRLAEDRSAWAWSLPSEGPPDATLLEKISAVFWLTTDRAEPARVPWSEVAEWQMETGYALSARRNANGRNAVSIDEAIFLLVLYLERLNELPLRGSSIEPFSVPWVYKMTSDPFADLDPLPDFATLLPAHGTTREVNPAIMKVELEQRWERMQRVREQHGGGESALNPLTVEHMISSFRSREADTKFLKNVACLEATFAITGERSRVVQHRISKLMQDKKINKALATIMKLNSDYRHGRVAFPSRHSDQFDYVMEARRITRLAVDTYLLFADGVDARNREAVLRQIAMSHNICFSTILSEQLVGRERR